MRSGIYSNTGNKSSVRRLNAVCWIVGAFLTITPSETGRHRRFVLFVSESLYVLGRPFRL